MAIQERDREGQTLVGSLNVPSCVIGAQSKPGHPSGLILVTADGTEVVLWITDAGVITISDYDTFKNATS